MNNSITPFAFGDSMVRVHMDENGEPWFVAKDVASILGYRDSFNLTRMLDEDEKGTRLVSTPGGEQEMTVINESGLYTACLRSERPEAKPFRKWATGEVLPSIRKTGSYTMPQHRITRSAMQHMLENLSDEAKHLRPNVRSKVLWCAMKAAEMDNSGTDGVMENFTAFCRMVGEGPSNVEGQLARFAGECLVAESGQRSPAHRIYNALRLWWRQNGKGHMPSEKALAMILDCRFDKIKSSTVQYLNCGIRQEWRRA